MKRIVLSMILSLLLLTGTSLFALASSAPAPIVDLDASSLREGPLLKWRSSGTSTSFDVVPVGGATVERVDGRNAVVFDGKAHRLVSSFNTPDSITGPNPYTIAVWARNPSVETEEALVCWAPRGVGDGKTAQLNYGSSENFGAVTHWGKIDMGYDGGVPEAGKWHLIAVTYGGPEDPVERVYVNGRLNASEEKSLDLFAGGYIYLGAAGNEKLYSGALSAVMIYDYALSADELAFLATGNGKQPSAALVDLNADTLPAGEIATWKNNGTLGGSFGKLKFSPEVADVDGRKAVSFANGGWLQSNVALPGGQFTIELWAKVEQDNAQSGLATAALSVGHIAKAEYLRLGLSRESITGALESGRAAVGYKKAPALKQWHHIAYVYDNGTLRIFVNGELDREHRFSIVVPAGMPVNLGAAWQADKGVPYAGFNGAISRFRIYSSALTQQQIRANDGKLNAFNPGPGVRSIVDKLNATLTWEAGNPAAKSFEVYFGEDADAVQSAARGSQLSKGRVPVGSPRVGPVKLEIDRTYYWRVDQLDAAGRTLEKGEVWQFSSDSGKATNPSPRNSVSAVPVSTSTLSWTPGKYATDQTIYIATQQDWESKSGQWTTAKLAARANSYRLPFKLQPGTRYCWRIDNQNGPNPATTGDTWCFRTQDVLSDTDVTFFAIADTHYIGPDSSPANQDLINLMNGFPGTPYPENIGGNVSTPRGVILTGDITDNGKQREWDSFVADYGLKGDRSLVYPMYELWGNHDGRTDGVVAQGMKQRNPSRPNLTMVSKNGLHYSWDWGKVHFACVNIYPAQVSQIVIPNDPIYSLEFLKEDLRKNVGDSGRPVVITMHYGLDGGGAGWWTPEEHQAFHDVIKDYNVIVMLFGHTHGGANYKWNGYDMVNVGAALSGGKARQFVVFRVTEDELIVARRFPDKWGEVLRKPITGMVAK